VKGSQISENQDSGGIKSEDDGRLLHVWHGDRVDTETNGFSGTEDTAEDALCLLAKEVYDVLDHLQHNWQTCVGNW
jgi:hypothetical protein